MNAPAAASHPWSTLGDIKKTHRDLLDAGEDLQGTPERVRNFIQQAAATGRFIEDTCERAEAQRLINYWLGSLPSSNRSERLAIKDTLLAAFDSAAPAKVTSDTDAFLKGRTHEEQSIAKQLFLRLVCLDPDGTTFSRISRTKHELLKGLQNPQAANILDAFKRLELVVPDQNEFEKLSLTDAPIIGRWATGDNWLAQRRRYRGAVRFWRSHGEDTTALLDKGELLDEAIQYLDLNKDEESFASKSRQRADKQLRKSVLIYAVAITMVASLLLSHYRQKAEAASEAAKMATENAVMLENKNKELGSRIEQIEGARYELATTVAKWEETKKLALLDLGKAAAEISVLQKSVTLTNVSNRLRSVSSKLQTAIEKLQPGAGSASSETTNTLRPGTEILVKGSNATTAATAGVIVWNPETKSRYLITPSYLLPAGEDGNIFSAGTSTQPIASFRHEAPSAAVHVAYSGRDPNDLAVIQISDTVNAANDLPDGSEVTQPVPVSEVSKGIEVFLAGKPAGRKHGKVIGYDTRTQLIRTTKMSEAGDAGALVVTKDGRPVGIVVGSYGKDQTLLKPLSPFLKTTSLSILPPSKK